MRLEELLAANAKRTPDAIAAMEANGKAMSYADLDQYAGEVSRQLVAVGVGAGDRVGLCVPKSIGAVASIFGVLKAGAAYVPVDVSAPAARNGYIFNDCAVKAIVADASCAAALRAELAGAGWAQHAFPAASAHPADFLILTPNNMSAQSAEPPQRDLAYILYTSGSTGRPKGVMHSHATALSFVDWCSEELKPRAEDRFSSHAPFHFDLSILDIYVPIKHGAAVVLIGSEAGKQPGTLADVITERRITIWYSTPSILRMLVEFGKLEARDCSALRIVIFAGEVFPIKHLRALMALWSWPAYYNLYGPTETNVCTYFKVPAKIPENQETSLPIGRACSGDRTRVVTPDGVVASPGGEGELLVAGGSVMLGYWNLPEQNANVFVLQDGARWYRTGDIVREDEKGEYIFLGRRDRMVKRRGFRVELGEIEAALHRHPAIPEAAVIATTKDEGEVQIHAFIAWTEAVPPSLVKLKQFCSQNLPLYMVPDRLSVVPELPKTSTDKIDYQRLKGLA
jgi:amino acid adenylation domain-containing protein